MADAGTAAPAPPPPATRERPWLPPAVLFVALMAMYHANGVFLPARDAQPNVYLAVNLLTRGSLSFAPREMPFMFTWEISGPAGKKTLDINSWDAELLPGVQAREIEKSGILEPNPRYFLVPSVREGRFVNIYGPGAGLSAVPYFAALSLTGSGWRENSGTLGYAAKFFASACVAGSAVLVYFTMLRFLRRPIALGLAFLYGLGTCVWTEPSQAIWQQTPTLFFVALGTWFLMGIGEGGKWAAGAGLSFGLAALCRPTLVLLLGAVGVYVLLKERKKSLIPYAAAGAVPVLILLAYNHHFLGSPFSLGQTVAARRLAEKMTWGVDVWSTPLWEGVPALLLSPSRGLLVFSPFFLFSFWGAVECWKDPAFVPLRPVVAALAALLALAAKWFEWYGGWCFGYRVIVELTPLWMALLLPVAARILQRKALIVVFGVTAVWAVLLQTLGAFSFDPNSWNGRVGYEVREPLETQSTVLLQEEDAARLVAAGRAQPVGKVRMDIGQPRFRHRLWSVSDSQISSLFSSGAFAEGRRVRKWLVGESYKEKSETPVR